MNIDDKSFRGRFLLYRKRGRVGLRPPGDMGGCSPKFRHDTYDAARAEAARLLAIHPQSTFVILQEVGRVKVADPDAATGCADDQTLADMPVAALRGAAETLRRVADHG
jgi:hypothetical protein